jgi:hypothetical protein
VKAHDRIEAIFPLLNPSNYTITSSATPKYNCLAWAVGDISQWWETGVPTKGYYWPPGIGQDDSPEQWAEIFQRHGYALTPDRGYEKGFERVAIYADDEGAQHVARQLQDGRWTSKLGNLSDIEHEALEILEGAYGKVTLVLKRYRPDWDQ